jgi:small subunit ribosomal protein S20
MLTKKRLQISEIQAAFHGFSVQTKALALIARQLRRGGRIKKDFDLYAVRLTFAVLKFSILMANHKATKKDMRQAAKRRERNKYYGKTTRNAIRDLKELKDGKEALKELPDVTSMIDKLAKRGVIHKNKAANLKSKLTRRVNTLASAK